jgi:hypothetical protein
MAMNPRLLRPTPTGFDPRRIAGLVAWWDASDSSTVTLNGSRVSQWSNKISGAPAMVQNDAANQPLYVTGGRNGRNIIQIDSTSRWLNNTTTTQVGFFAAVIAPTGTQSFGSTLSFVGKHGLIRNGTGNNAYFSPSSLFPEAAYRKNGAFTTLYGTDWAVFSQGGTVDTRAARIDVDGAGSVRSTCEVAEVLIYDRNLGSTERSTLERALGRKWGITVA